MKSHVVPRAHLVGAFAAAGAWNSGAPSVVEARALILWSCALRVSKGFYKGIYRGYINGYKGILQGLGFLKVVGSLL